MIHFRLPASDRSTLVVGGGLILSLLLTARGLPAWYRWSRDAAESAGATVAEASAARMSVNRHHELEAARAHAELSRMEVEPVFVNGSEVAAATAALAAVVADAATGSGLRMGALQTNNGATPADSGDVQHVSVRGEASGDVTAVTQFLAALEGRLPLLAVRELSVAKGESNTAAGRAESLHLDFVIDALAHSEPADGPRK